MAEKQFKTKDMIIAVICTILAVLSIVFYFLPAFSVEHSASLNFETSEKLYYSAWDMTRAVFASSKDFGSSIIGLLYIKDVYSMAVVISGIVMPIGIACIIATTVFAYLSWFKGEKFKKLCFLFGLCGMMFTTITLISTWYIAIQLRSGNGLIDYFYYNIKGSIAYGSFVSLIISFVVAIVACAYNYFLDNFDEEEVEEEEEEVDIQPEKHTQKLAKVTTSESIKSSKPSKKSSK
ncbi:MAG: hypothetical protein MR412_00745 [Firmicutes bacterium]|nr:hypothetical protein [Bacillota bacterium]